MKKVYSLFFITFSFYYCAPRIVAPPEFSSTGPDHSHTKDSTFSVSQNDISFEKFEKAVQKISQASIDMQHGERLSLGFNCILYGSSQINTFFLVLRKEEYQTQVSLQFNIDLSKKGGEITFICKATVATMRLLTKEKIIVDVVEAGKFLQYTK